MIGSISAIRARSLVTSGQTVSTGDAEFSLLRFSHDRIDKCSLFSFPVPYMQYTLISLC